MVGVSVTLRKLSPAVVLLIGMGISQLIGTLQVALSNNNLHNKILALIAAGYDIVPGYGIQPALQSFQATVGGGLFFTLTIGVSLSLFTVFWWQLFHLFSLKPKWGGHILAIGVIFALMWCNRHGFNEFGSAYLILIPTTISLLSSKKSPSIYKNASVFFIVMFITPLVMLSLMGLLKMERQAFIKVRDQIFLTNRAGQLINDFYYRHTLFPAEAIKPLEQKQIRTVYLSETFLSIEKTKLNDRFSSIDYLPVNKKALADIIVQPDIDEKIAITSKRSYHTVNLRLFLTAPESILKKISKETDNQRVFRKMIYWSLIIGMPLFIYGVLYQSIGYLLSRFFSSKATAAITAITCLVVGVVVLWPLNTEFIKTSSVSSQDLIVSQQLNKRLRALKIMDSDGLDISNHPVYEEIKGSRNMVERYWLARILVNSRSASTHRDLLFLLNDVSPNVICMALRSLGLRKNRDAIPVIVALIKKSNHWYVQWYAYNALKKLTWRQYALS